jgi:hypothetical protein
MNWMDKQSVFPSIRESQQKILAHDANLVEQFHRWHRLRTEDNLRNLRSLW